MKRNYILTGIIFAIIFATTVLDAQQGQLLDIYNNEVISYGGYGRRQL